MQFTGKAGHRLQLQFQHRAMVEFHRRQDRPGAQPHGVADSVASKSGSRRTGESLDENRRDDSGRDHLDRRGKEIRGNLPFAFVWQRTFGTALMDKRAVIQMVVAQIERDLAVLITATKATHGEATDEQNKAENKYDTRALEASYLAQGQSRQVAELLKAKQEFELLSMADWPANAAIDVGAMVMLRRGSLDTLYLLGPKGGGIEVSYEGTPVTVITPQSPLGQRLMGKAQGELVALPSDPVQKQRQIVRIW